MRLKDSKSSYFDRMPGERKSRVPGIRYIWGYRLENIYCPYKITFELLIHNEGQILINFKQYIFIRGFCRGKAKMCRRSKNRGYFRGK